MKKSTGCMLALLHLLIGIGIGFFASAMKNGFSAGNNSGNTNYTYNYYGMPPHEEDEDDSNALEI